MEEALLDFITNVYDGMSWPGVVILMALETIIFVIPSEAVMTFAGWLLIRDKGLGLEWVALAGILGALGSTIGSVFFYCVGVWGGRAIIERYGRYVFISPSDLDRAERFFDRWGGLTVFFGRMVPLVRSFISIPAGVARMDLRLFLFYTFLGSFIWATMLAYIGYRLGENWDAVKAYFGAADIVIAVLLVLFVVYIFVQIKESWEVGKPSGPEA